MHLVIALLLLVLVEEGAEMIVASTMAQVDMRIPWLAG
jgi:hypothetical protein